MKDFLESSATRVSILLLKNPKVLGILAVFFILFIFIYLIFMQDDLGNTQMSEDTLENYYIMCEPRDIENDSDFRQSYLEQFEGKGALENTGTFFLRMAHYYEIDPVLLASIAFFETGNGTSKMVKERNNPGGLYNSSAKDFYEYSTLREGIEEMASNIYKLYISEGLLSISQIGSKYAPIGVENDPNNLNANWVPQVSSIANNFGGLILNCDQINFGNGELASPTENFYVTSKFGPRRSPGQGASTYHRGLDLRCSRGDPIYSALEGIVIGVTKHCREGDRSCGGRLGNFITIRHDGFDTRYAHLSSATIPHGSTVSTSQLIGTCGNTGGSVGAHLHFEVILQPSGERVDPAPYFNSPE